MPLFLALLLQVTPVAPIPKGTVLPPPDMPEAGPMAAVDAVLRAIATHDRALLLANVIDPDSPAITAALDGPAGGFLHMPWRTAADVGKDGWPATEQRLTDPAVELDDTIAMVWSPYVSIRDGKVWHCGFVHFDLIRVEGRWKVQTLTRSQHATGCPGQ